MPWGVRWWSAPSPKHRRAARRCGCWNRSARLKIFPRFRPRWARHLSRARSMPRLTTGCLKSNTRFFTNFMNPEILDRARKVRLLVMDVDGVLTDGRLIIVPGPDGTMFETKAFD